MHCILECYWDMYLKMTFCLSRANSYFMVLTQQYLHKLDSRIHRSYVATCIFSHGVINLILGKVDYPIEGPYQNSTIKRFNQLYPDGKTAIDVTNDQNDEPDCIGRIAPVVTKWAG